VKAPPVAARTAVALADFVIRAFRETKNNQVLFSPEFTTCGDCGATLRGLHEKCKHCGAESCEGLARITQYYSRISGWRQGQEGRTPRPETSRGIIKPAPGKK